MKDRNDESDPPAEAREWRDDIPIAERRLPVLPHQGTN